MSLREVGDRALAMGSPGVLVLPADVSKPDQCEKFIDDTIRYFGRCKGWTYCFLAYTLISHHNMCAL